MFDRMAPACGAAFVALTLAGNSLTDSATDAGAAPSARSAADDLAAYADSGAARLGFALEVVALLALLVFAAHAAARIGERSPLASRLALVAGAVLAAVKLGSGAALLGGIAHRKVLSPDAQLALVASNDAAFVLCWVPMALLVGSLAVGLRSASVVGPPTAGVGLALAVLTLLAALTGLDDVTSAVPVPFLLSLVALAVVSVRLVLVRAADGPAQAPRPASAGAR